MFNQHISRMWHLAYLSVAYPSSPRKLIPSAPLLAQNRMELLTLHTNGYIIYVDIWTGEKLSSIQVGQFFNPGGGEGRRGESLFQPATSFTLLEIMKIWCNIHVMIDPFLQLSVGRMVLLGEKVGMSTNKLMLAACRLVQNLSQY